MENLSGLTLPCPNLGVVQKTTSYFRSCFPGGNYEVNNGRLLSLDQVTETLSATNEPGTISDESHRLGNRAETYHGYMTLGRMTSFDEGLSFDFSRYGWSVGHACLVC